MTVAGDSIIMYDQDLMFFRNIITGDEIWCYFVQPTFKTSVVEMEINIISLGKKIMFGQKENSVYFLFTMTNKQ